MDGPEAIGAPVGEPVLEAERAHRSTQHCPGLAARSVLAVERDIPAGNLPIADRFKKGQPLLFVGISLKA